MAEFNCIVSFSADWEQRAADALTDLYYSRLTAGNMERGEEAESEGKDKKQ